MGIMDGADFEPYWMTNRCDLILDERESAEFWNAHEDDTCVSELGDTAVEFCLLHVLAVRRDPVHDRVERGRPSCPLLCGQPGSWREHSGKLCQRVERGHGGTHTAGD